MNKEERNSFRKEMLGKLEEQWAKSNSPEDDLFYYLPSEDKIVLSHALFWVMTQNIKGKVGKEKYLLLLRQYQEEMLEAYLSESEDFKDLLHYCNIMYGDLHIVMAVKELREIRKKMFEQMEQLLILFGYKCKCYDKF